MQAQAQAILKVIASVGVEQAEMELTDVVRTMVYVRNINDTDAVAKAHLEVFGSVRPASTLV
ncbi:Rid family hydrolase [Pseudomonas oryzihabitans]|uniref:Rid family hydrolase n=1 Tax=Pseudomonas oryzihabitans TaxID=47885 RepID=UPI0028943579|nr:Rid family hydrolase [Pseudomonas oryzihabitans]MDT3722833.1 Rid family hydrolase [Pseudomonas oryzihabitans]